MLSNSPMPEIECGTELENNVLRPRQFKSGPGGIQIRIVLYFKFVRMIVLRQVFLLDMTALQEV